MSLPTPSLSEQLTDTMRTHYNALFDYGLKLTHHDEDLTKDCIQDVFAQFWNHRHEWATIQSVKAYLLVALRNRIANAHRDNRRFVPLLTFPDTDESETISLFAFQLPDDPDLGTLADAPLRNLLDRLPRRQREALFLRYFQELDTAEVARVMGVKERTVYNLVHEGLQQLRQHLTPARWAILASILGAMLFFLKNF